jgi:hypothetical protein
VVRVHLLNDAFDDFVRRAEDAERLQHRGAFLALVESALHGVQCSGDSCSCGHAVCEEHEHLTTMMTPAYELPLFHRHLASRNRYQFGTGSGSRCVRLSVRKIA